MALEKQISGPLCGFPALLWDWKRFREYTQAAIAKGVRYGFGSKDPVLGAWPIDYDKIDCSGFVRTLLHYVTKGLTGELGMPDGSFVENDWFRHMGFKYHPGTEYLTTCNQLGFRVYVCIHRPGGRGNDSVGHIWLVTRNDDGTLVVTTESYGGHGPGHREWNHQTLVDIVDDIYVIA